MNTTFHIFKKDLFGTRHLLALWALIVLAQLVLIGFSGSPAGYSAGTAFMRQMLFSTLAVLLPVLQTVLVIVLIPLVIQAEPLVGTTAFWMTRPISSRRLLAAKSLYAAVLLLLPLFVQLIVLWANDATWSDLALATPQVLMTQGLLILSAALLASVTRNFGYYAVAAAVLVVVTLVAGWVFSVLGIASGMRSPIFSRIQNISLVNSITVTGSVIGLVLYGGLLAFQYATRRAGLVISLAFVATLFAASSQYFWKWDFLRPPSSVAGFAEKDVKVRLQGASMRTASSSQREGSQEQIVSTLVQPVGLPEGMVLDYEEASVSLQTEAGVKVRTSSVFQTSFDLDPRKYVVQGLLGSLRLLNGENRTFDSVDLFKISDELAEKYRTTPLRLSVDLQLRAWLYRRLFALPVKPGATWSNGVHRLVITNILQFREDQMITLQERRLDLLFRPSQGLRALIGLGDFHDSVYVLVNARRGEAIVSKSDFSPDLLRNSSLLTNKSIMLRFGPDDSKRGADLPELTPAWLAEAELVRFDLHPVASFARKIEKENFELTGDIASQLGRKRQIDHTALEKIAKNLAGPADAPSPASPSSDDALKKISLPEDATPDQLRDYVAAILAVSQKQKILGYEDPQVAMLKTVGSKNLNLLIDFYHDPKYPKDLHLRHAVNQLIKPRDRALILARLWEKPDLSYPVMINEWASDARETLLTGLASGREDLPTTWINAIVALNDKSTYPALRDYFQKYPTRLGTYEALKMLPDIKVEELMPHAWAQAMNGSDGDRINLLTPAAECGIAESIDVAARFLRDAKKDYHRRVGRKVLTEFTPAQGDDAALLAWYEANKGRLAFNPTRRIFEPAP